MSPGDPLFAQYLSSGSRYSFQSAIQFLAVGGVASRPGMFRSEHRDGLDSRRSLSPVRSVHRRGSSRLE